MRPADDPKRRSILAALAAVPLALLGRTQANADPVEDGTFRREVVALLARERPGIKLTLHGEKAVLIIAPMEVYLGNLHRRVEGLRKAEREAEILKFIDGIATPKITDDTYAAVKDLLRVQLVPANYAHLKTGDKQQAVVHRPLSAHVIVAYAIDEPSRYALVLPDQMAKWGVSHDVIHEQAVANLEAASAEIKPDGDAAVERFATFIEHDSYAAARSLCPQFMARLHGALGPVLYLGIPNRDFLVAWNPEFERKSGFAAQVAKDFASQHHPLSPDLLVSEAGKLRPATKAEMAQHGR